MKQLIITIAALLLLPLAVMAQYEEDTENGVVSLNGKEGFTIATKKGDFVFKPYMLVFLQHPSMLPETEETSFNRLGST